MSKRSKACEFDDVTRQLIYERDGGKCVLCGSSFYLSIAHLIPRSRGGLGICENGALLCAKCHHELDNGKERVAYRLRFAEYIDHLYKGFPDSARVYKKGE